jgi:hypothetical protein
MDVKKLMVVALASWINRQQEVQCRERLGGLLRYYYRDAA